MTSPIGTNQSNPFSGWDIAVAALALSCMTTGFWRLWPDALALNDAPLAPVILKAGVAALGFVAIASRWEKSIIAIARNPFGLMMIALACVSSMWAVVPSEALRNAIVLLVVWSFGIGLTLRFRPSELAEICGFAGIVGVVMQVTAHKGVPPVDHFDGDLAFALIGSIWAALRVPARRTLWMISAGFCFAFAFAATEKATLGAILGFVFGVGVAACAGALAKRGAISVLITAWAIVACVIVATMFLMFGAGPVANDLSRYFSDLGNAMVIGQGFGGAGLSVGDSIGAGLGLLGVGIAALVVMATFFQALFGNSASGRALVGHAGVFFACVGAVTIAPAEVAITGPILILFAAASFAISSACAPKVRKRVPLMSSQAMPSPRRPQTQLAAVRERAEAEAPAAFGLRPKI
jgi:hypothetical protein